MTTKRERERGERKGVHASIIEFTLGHILPAAAAGDQKGTLTHVRNDQFGTTFGQFPSEIYTQTIF
jgi:hypothetical protein